MNKKTGVVFSLYAVLLIVACDGVSAHASTTSEEDAVVVANDGVRLSGKWSLPAEPLAAILILQGSGNVGSDGDVSGPLLGTGYRGAPAKLSDQIATKLALSGIASLRYSKRGFEDSAQLVNQTMPYLTSDARSALGLVRQRFPGKRIGIIGFSEGALIAAIVASQAKVDSLFLMGLPSRPIDEVLKYQFLEWPLELMRRKLDLNHDDQLSPEELQGGPNVPLLGPGFQPAPAKDLDSNHDGVVSISREAVPAYLKLYSFVGELLKSPQFAGWYEGLKQLSPFAEYARRVAATVHIYHGIEDAQVKWTDNLAAQRMFSGSSTVRLFPGLGHCFAPMAGGLGEIKTSGPLSEELLSPLAEDVRSSLQ